MTTFTVLIYPEGDQEPVTYPDVDADTGDHALELTLGSWPIKRTIRSSAVYKNQEQ